MVPLLDMVNHASLAAANAVVFQDERNGSFGCEATRNISAGQEVRRTATLHRMGFCVPQAEAYSEHPLPCLSACLLRRLQREQRCL